MSGLADELLADLQGLSGDEEEQEEDCPAWAEQFHKSEIEATLTRFR